MTRREPAGGGPAGEPVRPSVPTGVWKVEQVMALAPRATALAAAQGIAVADRWRATGCTDTLLWGRCSGGSAEPYDCVVEHRRVLVHCTCASRRQPCKHVLALLLLWVGGAVPEVEPSHVPDRVLGALAAMERHHAAATTSADGSAAEGGARSPARSAVSPRAASAPEAASRLPDRDSDRSARMRAGLSDLARWIDDRMRTGVADPALAQYRTWDDLAARLVDAQLGGLANRVRRLAGVVGSRPDWHEAVVAELGVLHLLAEAGRRLHELSPPLAESVAAALGWQVRQSDVLAGVPDTDHWVVLGRSDTREDRIEVRRWWLRGLAGGRWAMLLSFAAYGQALDDGWSLGDVVHADLHRYPGALGLRSLVGRRLDEPRRATPDELTTSAVSITTACAELGAAIATEPWIERWPLCVRGTPTRQGDEWLLTDDDASLPVARGSLRPVDTATLLACAAGGPAIVTAEWTPTGVQPVGVHLADRSVDVGPIADPGFVDGGARR